MLLETIYMLGLIEPCVLLMHIVRIPFQVPYHTIWHCTGTVALLQVMYKSYLYEYKATMPTNVQ